MILRYCAPRQKHGTSRAVRGARHVLVGQGANREGYESMAQLLDRQSLEGPQSRGERDKAVKILAKSIYRQLRESGYETRQIVALSSELIGLITTEIKPDSSPK